jgi:hypothetical protein
MLVEKTVLVEVGESQPTCYLKSRMLFGHEMVWISAQIRNQGCFVQVLSDFDSHFVL